MNTTVSPTWKLRQIILIKLETQANANTFQNLIWFLKKLKHLPTEICPSIFTNQISHLSSWLWFMLSELLNRVTEHEFSFHAGVCMMCSMWFSWIGCSMCFFQALLNKLFFFAPCSCFWVRKVGSWFKFKNWVGATVKLEFITSSF